MANTTSIQNRLETENPSRATAVRNTLATVTTRVPSFRVSRSDRRLDMTVPPDMIMETIPMKEMGTFSAACMTGHPEPSSESGSPRLIKAI